MFWSTWWMVKLNGSTWKSGKKSHLIFIVEDLSVEVSSLSSSLSRHHQEVKKNYWGEEMDTNVDEFALLIWGIFDPIIPLAIADLRELVQCCLELQTIEDSHVCHVPFPKWSVGFQIVDLSNAPIDSGIPLLSTHLMYFPDAYGRGSLPDHPLTLLSIHGVVQPPFYCLVPMVSTAHWLTPTPAFLAHTVTFRVSIWIVLPSATTDFNNQKASHIILGFEQWWMSKW